MAGSPSCSSSTMSWGKVWNLCWDLCSVSTIFIFLTEHLVTEVCSPLLSPPVWLHQTRIGLSLYDVAGQGYLRESVSYILFFSIWRNIMVCYSLETVGWQLCLGAGSGELHPGANPHSASARWTGEVLLLFLRLHRRSQVLFLPRPTSNRWDRTTLTKIDQEK